MGKLGGGRRPTLLERWLGRLSGSGARAAPGTILPSTDGARLRSLISSIGPVAHEPGHAPGYVAFGGVRVAAGPTQVELWLPPQDEMPARLRVGLGEPASRRFVGLDGSAAALSAWDWESGAAVEPVVAEAALSAATQLLAKIDARRRAWAQRLDRAAAERIVRAFFAAWPQSLAAALSTFERQLGPTPVRHPMETDTDEIGSRFWLAVFGAGHASGLRLVDFVRERDPRWIADRLREQPEPAQAAGFRAKREARLTPAELAEAMDAYLAALGWRLVMFDRMYGKPMPAAAAAQLLADAPAAHLAGELRITLGAEAFREPPRSQQAHGEAGIPPRFHRYACGDYFGSPDFMRGVWDSQGQIWLILPSDEVDERADVEFLAIGRPGVDGIEFGYRAGHDGIWAFYPLEARFVYVARDVAQLVDDWLAGEISV